MPRSEDEFDPKKCSCGSSLENDEEYDARGTFLTYACDKCRAKKLAGYRPDVRTDPNYWADEAIEGDD